MTDMTLKNDVPFPAADGKNGLMATVLTKRMMPFHKLLNYSTELLKAIITLSSRQSVEIQKGF